MPPRRPSPPSSTSTARSRGDVSTLLRPIFLPVISLLPSSSKTITAPDAPSPLRCHPPLVLLPSPSRPRPPPLLPPLPRLRPPLHPLIPYLPPPSLATRLHRPLPQHTRPRLPKSLARFYSDDAKASPPTTSVWSFDDNSNGALGLSFPRRRLCFSLRLLREHLVPALFSRPASLTVAVDHRMRDWWPHCKPQPRPPSPDKAPSFWGRRMSPLSPVLARGRR